MDSLISISINFNLLGVGTTNVNIEKVGQPKDSSRYDSIQTIRQSHTSDKRNKKQTTYRCIHKTKIDRIVFRNRLENIT